MLSLLFQGAKQAAKAGPGRGVTAVFRHFGAAGLFFFAIIDSSPLPTFNGADVLIAILAASRRDAWYEYAAMTTAGSVIGAWLTFRLGREAGGEYLTSHRLKAGGIDCD